MSAVMPAAAQWAEQIRDELIRRNELILLLTKDREARALALERWRRDVVEFVRDMCWGFDPRLRALGKPSLIPFIPWPRQIEYLHWMDAKFANQETALTEKTRDCGASYLACLWMLHKWRFFSQFKGMLASADKDLVDKKGDPDSLFEKLRINLRAWPIWLMPDGFDFRFHDYVRQLTNPENGSVVVGEHGEEIGRGGRSGFAVLDEHAAMKNSHRVSEALSYSAPSWVSISTVRGMGNEFARMRFSGNYDVFTFDWRDDPRKDEEWYGKECAKWAHNMLVVRQEIDRDYNAGSTGVHIPGTLVQSCVGAPIKASGQCVAGLDIAKGPDAQSVYYVRQGAVTIRTVAWNNLDTTATALKALDLAEEDGCYAMYYDSAGLGAGVEAAYKNMRRKTSVKLVGVNWGIPANDSDRFMNLKAELWFAVRYRIEQTHEWMTNPKALKSAEPPDSKDLLCFPRHGVEELIVQLSLPKVFYTETGKARIESKKELAARGVSSPDHADACVLSFAGNSIRANTGDHW